jgi:hypothetical protein
MIALLEREATTPPPEASAEGEGFGEYVMAVSRAVVRLQDPASLRGLALLGIQTSAKAGDFVASFGTQSLPYLDEAWSREGQDRAPIVRTWARMLGEFGGTLSDADRTQVLNRIIQSASAGEEMAFVLAAEKVPLPASLPIIEILVAEGRNEVVRSAATDVAGGLVPIRDALTPLQVQADLEEWLRATCLGATEGRASVCEALADAFEAGPGNAADLQQVVEEAESARQLSLISRYEAAVLAGGATYLLGRQDPPVTRNLLGSADTYLRSGNPNQNQGSETILRVRPDGDRRALIQFDQAALAAAVGSGTVTSARLELTIAENFDNWGATGRTVDLHRLTQTWTELGATWNCGDDLAPGNPVPDCPTTAWTMSGLGVRPWLTPPTATMTITTGLRGVVSFDVTADVQAFLGGQPNYGWLLKRTEEGPSGAIDFAARESGTPPRLVLQVQ